MLRPVRKRALSKEVFEQLRDEIVRGAYAAGAALPAERALCEAFGVNRGSVREALRRLQQARLVSVRHGGTSHVLDFRASAGLDHGFGFITGWKWCCAPPSGISLREAMIGHFEIGPLHNFLGKGCE